MKVKPEMVYAQTVQFIDEMHCLICQLFVFKLAFKVVQQHHKEEKPKKEKEAKRSSMNNTLENID